MSPHRLKIITILVVLVALLGISIVRYGKMLEKRALKIPDEKAAGVELLAKTQSGPGYFHESKEATPDSDGPWITPDQANAQFGRVVAERKFSPAQTEKVKQLVTKLTEPHPSRLVGTDRIQLVRLNLALDEIKE